MNFFREKKHEFGPKKTFAVTTHSRVKKIVFLSFHTRATRADSLIREVRLQVRLHALHLAECWIMTAQASLDRRPC